MAKFDSKSFNPQAFGSYLEKVPQTRKNEFIKSGILVGNENIRNAFSSQTGTCYAIIPMHGNIDGAPTNYDGVNDIEATSTTTYEQGVVVIGRAKAWTEKDFSTDITGGVDFMGNVAKQVSEYWDTVDQDTILQILKGVFGMNTSTGKKFVDAHTYDIKGAGTEKDPGVCSVYTLNNALQKACGDNKSIFELVIMHSTVATNLENIKLLSYAKYTDANGIEKEMQIGSWNGRLVLIDDSVPTEKITKVGTESDPNYVAEGTAYITYVFGKGAFAYEDIGAKVPHEMARDPKTTGGVDTLYTRQRKVFAPYGISFTKKSMASSSPTDAELADKQNWELVNDGNGKTIDIKAIPIARIISRG